MKTSRPHGFVKASMIAAALILAASTSWATLITWNFNPSNLNQDVGSTSNPYTVSGYTITAYGYDNPANTPHELYYKAQPFGTASETGLGFVGTPSNEIGIQNGVPVTYMQLDLTSILAQGFTNGQININSVQNGEGFQLFGSNVLGQLGVQIGGTFSGLANDNVFVNVPNFGQYKFLSVVSAAGSVLLNSFQAEVVPIPEVASLIPVLFLIAIATAFEARRRRRATA